MELGQGEGARRSVGTPTERGYAMAALLVGLSVMAVLMTAAMPVWSQFAKREKEAELIWRGQQYMRAIAQFQRRYANTFPPSVDILVEQKFLRKKYKDPITDDDFQPIPAGGGVNPAQLQGVGGRPPAGATPPQGRPGAPGPATPSTPTVSGVPGGTAAGSIGIQGVVSKSRDTAIKIYNGRTHYNEWAFIALVTNQRAGTGAVPGGPGTQGQRPSGRPPVPGETGGSTFSRPGQSGPGGQPSPFGQPPPGGRPGMPGQPPPQRPPGR